MTATRDPTALARCRALFAARFGAAPSVIVRAPGRVNLIGEHVDYAEGFVLPIAIERSTYVAARRTAARSSTLVSDATGAVDIDVTQSLEPLRGASAWANYVVGPMRELADVGHDVPNVEIAIASDLALGGGLSSSAALEVATTLATLELLGAEISRRDVALLCQRAEHRYAGTPCGIMDMTVSANARDGHAMLLDCRTLAIEHVPMPKDLVVLVMDSGVRHRLAEGGYAARRASVEAAAQCLGVAALRDATSAMVDAATTLDDVTRRRARHVTSEIERTREAARALRRGDASRFGALMNASHDSLRDDFEVSIPEVDCLAEALRACRGVVGARMTGGGFGGSVIALGNRDELEAAAMTAAAEFRGRFGETPAWFVTGAAGGAGVSKSEPSPSGGDA